VQRWAEAALDGQLKGMKTSLRLTADQEELWNPFGSAVKDGAKTRVVALQREQNYNLSPMDRLNTKAERISQSAANLKKIFEAAKPLYASFDDAQKHEFITLGRMLVPERGRFAIEMKRLRVGEGDKHGAAPVAIGGTRHDNTRSDVGAERGGVARSERSDVSARSGGVYTRHDNTCCERCGASAERGAVCA
jgi:LTXXQ motif family protein